MGGAATTSGTATTATTTGGTGGGPDDPEPLSCESFPGEDPHDHCEPKLRALYASSGVGLLTFEYDDAGRLTSVGDERDHENHAKYRRTYDEEGRFVRFEEECALDACDYVTELSYAPAGWLQTVVWAKSMTYTYDESGRLFEDSYRTTGAYYDTYDDIITRYVYRSDGQLATATTVRRDENGDEEPWGSETWEYGDDDLLDRILRDGYVGTEYTHVVEDGRVRVETSFEDYGWDATIFDDSGREAFGYREQTFYPDEAPPYRVQRVYAYPGSRWAFSADPDTARAGWSYVDGASFNNSYFAGEGAQQYETAFYGPLDLTPDDIDDFSYVFPRSGGDILFSREVAFSDEGLLEHLTYSWSWSGAASDTAELEILRCGNVVIETMRIPDLAERAEATLFFYGCDDFVLPAIPDLGL